jgi:hypothetical protein
MNTEGPVQLLDITLPHSLSPLQSCSSISAQSDALGRFRAAFVAGEDRHNVQAIVGGLLAVLRRGAVTTLKKSVIAALNAIFASTLNAIFASTEAPFTDAVSSWIQQSDDLFILTPETCAFWTAVLEEPSLRRGLAAAGFRHVTSLLSMCVAGVSASAAPDVVRSTARLVPLALQADASKCTSLPGEITAHHSTLDTLMTAYAALMASGALSRDTTTIVSMALASVLRSVLLIAADVRGETNVTKQQQDYLLQLLAPANSDSNASVADLGGASTSVPVSSGWIQSLGTITALAFIRSITVAFPAEVLGMPIPLTRRPIDYLAVHKDAMPAVAPCLLTSCIAPTILRFCLHQDPDLRLYAIQSLESWLVVLRRTNAWFAAARRDSSSTLIDPALISDILRLVLANWEHANRRITSAIPHVFDLVQVC